MSKILFYDTNTNMCLAWEKVFKDIDEIEIQNKPFEEIKATYVVTAGNSYGIMTGGISYEVAAQENYKAYTKYLSKIKR